MTDANTPTKPISAKEILSRWPTFVALARDLGVPETTVYSWNARNRIPADREEDLVESAGRHGLRLTFDELRAARRPRSTPARSGQENHVEQI